ncbi:TrkH family potassium uptake protein [Clostridium chauvoei]|uniref:TrkH family potassium uptake protein n=2 Tax=Clostridium chauvoei TaxID=46867 RepID=A0ABD4RDY0_9CLOT|nr:TrkH family potassium uptake protein [Clostridium chauvoei]ATD55274.1 Trk family potassium uptake protein [Clostridium chauvoei]ATD57053.1 Trk family potassium uptake protein [Clostridium chauvoei]MBX7279624.1 TrkH family potassium uptake protein [Clostridium chauvoei]MBX7281993.1 TrkH family potassium uptake protein [Clostridium chauvoei]MBX7284418.1 TrkH family potassium uptake protein [Clostridium chauvoei]
MQFKLKKEIKLNGVQILALGFLTVIFLGAIILSLPISSANRESTSFLDSLFTSTSAVCVTGLVTLNTSAHWSVFGQTVIMMLIEIGGLGFMSFTTLIAIVIGKRITLRERLVMQEAMNTFSIQGLVSMVRYVFGFTFAVQLFGALLMSTQFIPKYGLKTGIFYSIFHSISAFCNAGFDLFGNSLVGYSDNIVIILVISALIIIGGIGFTVWLEIYHYKSGKRLTVHAKIVILMSVVLVFGGAILMFIFECRNPETLAGMNFKDKVLNAFFASVTPRTAGFNSISINGMTMAGKFLTILLMFIGGSPGSTAGGLKTSTFGIIILTVISVIKGREDTEVFGRRFAKELVYKAFALLFIGVGLIIVVTMMLSYTEVGATFMDLLYETTSAFGTVGLTTGLTPNLSNIGKVLIMLMMYFGRVGPLTVALALTRKRKKTGYKYPEGKILIG